jgi:hypothetical protein
MSHREFQRIAGKYAGVVAVPIIDPDTEKYKGCVALDIAHDQDFDKITHSDIIDIVADAAVSLAYDLRHVGRRPDGG